MPKSISSPKVSPTSGKKICPICETRCHFRGYSSHVRKCGRERRERKAERRYIRELKKLQSRIECNTGAAAPLADRLPFDGPADVDQMDFDAGLETLDPVRDHSEPIIASPSAAQTTGPPDGPMTDKITTEYHPNSGRPPRPQSFEEYNDERQFFSSRPTGSAEPWLPFFNTREDFEFAEILMESNMSKVQSERLIKLVKLCLDRKGTLTFSNYSDLQTTWDRAASQLTPFSVDNISVRYNGVDQTFPMSFRPLWDWAVDLIMNPQLADRFVWDARRIFTHNGETTTRTRVYHEPWTGDGFWDLQVCLLFL